MKDIDDLLRRHGLKPTRQLSSNFTSQVIARIEAQPRKWHHFASLQEFYMKVSHLPRYVLVAAALIGIPSVSAGAYATYQWLAPKVSVLNITANNDDNKREFTVDIQNCGVMIGGQTADNGRQQFEVAKDAGLNDEQFVKVLKNSCEYQRVLQHINDWHDNSVPGAGGPNVLNDPSLGKITALDSTHVTITTKVYQQYDGPNAFLPGDPEPDFDKLTQYFSNGKDVTRTFEISPNADVLDKGQIVSRDRLKVGDSVVFLSTVTEGGTPGHTPIIGPVAHFIKTTIDPDYVQTMGVGNPAIVSAIARLGECQGNTAYLCVGGSKMSNPFLRFKVAYSSKVMTETPLYDHRFDGNEKYFRADITNETMQGDFFHAIEGRITRIEGAKLTLRSRGKAETFTVTLPYDAVKVFNDTQKARIATDDYIQVTYLQHPNETRTDIKSGDLQSLSLLQRELADGSLVNY